METVHNPKLTCSELGSLWATYVEETMISCIYQYFHKVAEDPDIRTVLQKTLNYSQQRVKKVADIFTQEKIPLPHGFTDQDVNLEAPSLFSDLFVIRYLKLLASFDLGAFTTGKSLSVREDIRKFYTDCMLEASSIYDEAVNLMLSKGILVRAPFLAYPDKVEYEEKQQQFFNFFGDKRPLNAIEIAHLGTNAETNLIGKVLIMGFSQVAKSDDIRNYFWKGKGIAEKIIEDFGAILSKDNIPIPASWDGTLNSLTVSPFSDKLLLFHIGLLNVSAMGDYGVSLAVSTRSDIVATYARIISDVGQYAAKGAAMLIENGWLEQPPQTLDREGLTVR